MNTTITRRPCYCGKTMLGHGVSCPRNCEADTRQLAVHVIRTHDGQDVRTTTVPLPADRVAISRALRAMDTDASEEWDMTSDEHLVRCVVETHRRGRLVGAYDVDNDDALSLATDY